MQPLVLRDPPVPFIAPQERRVNVALIGCGGTGSHLAQSLARLAAHCRDAGGPALELCFIDGDVVEPKNVGRQLFAPSDIGRNKAEVLAARFNAVWGLRIQAIPTMFAGAQTGLGVGYGVLVGCVDSAAGRQAMARTLGVSAWKVWLDCGNEDYAGQVVVGTTTNRQRLAGALNLGGVCTDLPAPSLVYPNLLDPPPVPRLDCAAAMEVGQQSLLVNSAIATVAAQYLYQLLVLRRLTTFETVIDLESLSMRSTPITARTLAPYMTEEGERPERPDWLNEGDALDEGADFEDEELEEQEA